MVMEGDDGDAPLGDLLQIRVAREPDVKRVEPLGEEAALNELAEHRRAQEGRPREDGLERLEVLRARVDLERVAQGRTKLGQDVLEDEGVPVGCREGLYRAKWSAS